MIRFQTPKASVLAYRSGKVRAAQHVDGCHGLLMLWLEMTPLTVALFCAVPDHRMQQRAGHDAGARQVPVHTQSASRTWSRAHCSLPASLVATHVYARQKLSSPSDLSKFAIVNIVGSADLHFKIRLEGLARDHSRFCTVRR